eukprot:CAMPEP_0170061580 /NCGR_PEP_ID=MMETSP0019_2-20121128/3096_1 /TAXON_ID=98059 /ORGANISM="Dinobryon sp., Strain UTEXLB2267" /LENGTH=150 /DNA_ID=CAMNT_0010267449 /DNA_START=893 /DNA_END=1345 /DNA_ORIENTATION=+
MAKSFRILSANTAFRTIKRLECVQACCLLGDVCLTSHPPALSCNSSIIFSSCLNLLKSDEPIPVWVESYKELLKMDFGSSDKDVEKILNYFKHNIKGVGKGSISMEEAEQIAERNRIALLAELEAEERVAKSKLTKSGNAKKGNASKKKK